VDGKPFVELLTGEGPGFLFGGKCLRFPRAASLWQSRSILHLKSNVPGVGHLSCRSLPRFTYRKAWWSTGLDLDQGLPAVPCPRLDGWAADCPTENSC